MIQLLAGGQRLSKFDYELSLKILDRIEVLARFFAKNLYLRLYLLSLQVFTVFHRGLSSNFPEGFCE